MPTRVILFLLGMFWLTMNGLLWRLEYGKEKHKGSPVPLDLVWQKILTAPDNSNLEVMHKGKKIGICRWAPNVGEELVLGKASKEDYRPEGRIESLAGYSIDLEGNLELSAELKRFRFHFNLQFTTNHQWKDFTLRAGQRPQFWDLHSKAAEQTLYFRLENEQGQWERTFRFAEFSNPQKLAQELGFPLLPAFLPSTLGQSGTGGFRLGLRWAARNDWLQMAHVSTRVYRIEARFLDRYEVVVLVSRVGEILRVELPDNLRLVNEALTHL